jgi:DNA modification methylase
MYQLPNESNPYLFINGDCCEEIKNIPSESIHLQVFSPPFAELYVYSDHIADMGNCKNYEEFFTHFSFLLPELNRILLPGRICAVHCMDLPIQKGKEGYIGLRDFSGMLIRAFQDHGFIYHTRVTIWKDPVVEMQRTKALGLLHKQVKKDSTMSRVGIPDYILVFRKEGDNPIPVKNTGIPVDLWQKYASPVWMDIDYSKTLNNYREGRDEKDEKHIAPLQLPTIERCIHLWSNPGETVFTPFAGIGSELYQSLKMGRNAIGIELKKSYYELAIRNCNNALESTKQFELIF